MMNINMKEEFLKHTSGRNIKCAYFNFVGDVSSKEHLLFVGYDSNQFEFFLAAIDYEYDCGYGCQELAGIIWYTDGTWSERAEYDGSEWWEYREVPEIPDVLK
jgi:hypothetical protein